MKVVFYRFPDFKPFYESFLPETYNFLLAFLDILKASQIISIFHRPFTNKSLFIELLKAEDF